jgi:hypothetical protein
MTIYELTIKTIDSELVTVRSTKPIEPSINYNDRQRTYFWIRGSLDVEVHRRQYEEPDSPPESRRKA